VRRARITVAPRLTISARSYPSRCALQGPVVPGRRGNLAVSVVDATPDQGRVTRWAQKRGHVVLTVVGMPRDDPVGSAAVFDEVTHRHPRSSRPLTWRSKPPAQCRSLAARRRIVSRPRPPRQSVRVHHEPPRQLAAAQGMRNNESRPAELVAANHEPRRIHPDGVDERADHLEARPITGQGAERRIRLAVDQSQARLVRFAFGVPGGSIAAFVVDAKPRGG
jgi:hypothetical protein